MTLVELLLSFFQIGLFSIGGGYAALPLIEEQVVNRHQWLTMSQFTDLITISQMTPGPIAINSATFVGNQIAGLKGSLLCTFGNVLPSFIIVLLLAYIYFKYKNITIVQGILNGLRPVVIALIASAGISILVTAFWGERGFSTNVLDINYVAAGLFCIGLIILRRFKPNPILVMMGLGVIGAVIYLSI